MKVKNIKAIVNEKFLALRYKGGLGIAVFIIKTMRWACEKILNFIEHKLIMVCRVFTKRCNKIELDLLLIQTNGLGDALINKEYNEFLIKSLQYSNDRVLIIAFDTWIGLKEKLYPDISVYFINKKKFEWNLVYRLSVYMFLSRYVCMYVVCNLRWKPRYVIKKLLAAISGQQFFISAHENSEPVQKTLFEEWCRERGFNCIDFSYIDSEFLRIPLFYKSVFQKKILDIGPQRTVLSTSQLESPVCPTRPYVVFHLGDSDKRKRWGLEKFINVGKELVSEGYKVVFVGGACERDLIGHINVQEFTVFIDELTLDDCINLFSGASAYVGGDTGPSHLAVALNIPCIIIVGGGTYGYYFPYPDNITPKVSNIIYCHANMNCYSCDWKCKLPLKSYWACIHSIDTYQVKKSLMFLLEDAGDYLTV